MILLDLFAILLFIIALAILFFVLKRVTKPLFGIATKMPSPPSNGKPQTLYDLAFQSTNLGSWEWDLKDQVIWNENNEKLFGYSVGKRTHSIADFIKRVHPDDLEEVLRIGKEAAKSKALFQNEYRIIWPDKSVHWVYSVGRVIFNSKNKPIEMIGINLEITSQKKVQEELAKQKGQISLATEIAQLGTWDTDLINDTHEWSPKTLEIFGFDPKTFNGRTEVFIERILPEDWIPLKKSLEESLEKKVDSYVEFRIILPDKTIRWISARSRPFFDLMGKPIRFIGTIRDITSEKQASEILNDQRKWLELVLDQMPIPLVMIEPKTARILFSNKEANKITKISDPYYCTDSHGEIISSEQLPGPRAAKGETISNFEMNWHTPEGIKSVLINSGMVKAQYGQPPIILMQYQDITKLKETESELAKALGLRDEFLSIASHELKTPLTSLKLQLEMTKRQILSEKVNLGPIHLLKVFDVSIRQANRLATLIDDLLDVSKIRAGRLLYNFNKIELSDLIKKACERVQSQIQKANCTLEVNAPSNLYVHWDASRIDQLLVNLLSNAAKYAPGKPVIITAEKKNAEILLSVKDFGPGIAKEKHNMIFNRFERGGVSQKDIAGLGLGLFIVKEIVKAHLGTVRIESEIGKGSNFIIELPINVNKEKQNYEREFQITQ